MKYIYGIMLIGWLSIEQFLEFHINNCSIASILGALCIFILKERFFNNYKISIIFGIMVVILSVHNEGFILLVGITVFDLMYFDILMGIVALIFSIFLSVYLKEVSYISVMMIGAFAGRLLGMMEQKEKSYISLFDSERRMRYEIERLKNEAVNSRKEIEYLTEVRERNRIAREIHDNIGHSIAGVLFQIRAASRIISRDVNQTEKILALCENKLTEALEMARNTVYNIKSDKNIGVDVINKLIEGYDYCHVEFEHSGNFERLSTANIEILEANIKEALTNTSKYSGATLINIRIDVKSRILRLYYRDNGKGCRVIHDSIGISSMRERVGNVGGTISIDGNNGFMIVCNIPINEDMG